MLRNIKANCEHPRGSQLVSFVAAFQVSGAFLYDQSSIVADFILIFSMNFNVAFVIMLKRYASYMIVEMVSQEYLSRAEFSLPSVTSEDAMPDKKAPIRVKFEIPYFTVSGIQVCISGFSISGIQVALFIISSKSCGTLEEHHRCINLNILLLVSQVRYLKIIEKSGYQALPWVRYVTMAGEYELRLIQLNMFLLLLNSQLIC